MEALSKLGLFNPAVIAYAKKPRLLSGRGGYYDLVRVPHGHVPVTKVFLWSRLPIPVREIRNDHYFKCPECGAPSFFKIDSAYSCRNCRFGLDHADWEDVMRLDRRFQLRWMRTRRHDYFRALWKSLEVLVLPFLVVSGRAWYVYSERKRYQRGL